MPGMEAAAIAIGRFSLPGWLWASAAVKGKRQ